MSSTVGERPESADDPPEPRTSTWRKWLDLTQTASIIALAISLFSFYHSYVYVNQQLDVTVTEVSYGTNSGELYMTVAFSNGGNRDAAVLRLEPALWARGANATPAWVPVAKRVAADLPLVSPHIPLVVKSGGVEVVTLSTMLDPVEAERTLVSLQDHAFLGLRVATMASDGNLYLLETTVARMRVAQDGHILSAEPAIHHSLSGFSDFHLDPPGELLTANKQTPFVWAEEHYR
jgi:hypothetical protein